MKKPYHILDSAKQQRLRPDELTRLLSQNAQLMLPLVELIEQCRGAVDEVIDVTGRAAIQAVLELSAQQVTGGDLSQPGKKRAGDVLRWGRQSGRVNLSDRKLRVAKPRLRKRSGGEVEVPAYEALQDSLVARIGMETEFPLSPSGSVRRCVRTQAVRARSLCSGLFGRVGSP